MRAFFSIPLGADIAASIDRIAKGVRGATDTRASWVRMENYHVTLRFLGEIDPLLTVGSVAASANGSSHSRWS